MLDKRKLLIYVWFFVALSLALIWGSFRLQNNSAVPASSQGGTSFQNPIDLSHVSLTNAREGKLSLSAFEGSLVLAFFGYTNCPDICPITLLDLADMYRNLGEPDDLQVLMITADPERDTADTLQTYVENFHASFLGLSGSNEEIAKATQDFFIAYAKQNDGLFLHTDVVFVLDRQGNARKLYGQQDLAFLANDIGGFQNNKW